VQLKRYLQEGERGAGKIKSDNQEKLIIGKKKRQKKGAEGRNREI